MTASFNPVSFQYRQVNNDQVPYHQETWSSTQSFADVRKVNHYQDPYHTTSTTLIQHQVLETKAKI